MRKLNPVISTALVALLLLAGGNAHAADAGTATWSLVPANGQGADGRTIIERDVDPGEIAQEFVEVRNYGPDPVVYTLDAADGYYTESDRFAMREGASESTDAGTWISIDKAVTIAPEARAVIPVTITVPEDATPGDHLAGIAASVSSPEGGQGDPGAVGVTARVGVVVALHVSGDVRLGAASNVSAAYSLALNPFSPGSLDVDYTIQNTGNVVATVQGTFTATGPFGMLPRSADIALIDRLAPGEIRTGRVTVPGVWPTFVTSVELTGNVSGIADAIASSDVRSSASAVSVPLPQLGAIVIATALAALWLLDRRRQRRLGAQRAPLLARVMVCAHRRMRRGPGTRQVMRETRGA